VSPTAPALDCPPKDADLRVRAACGPDVLDTTHFDTVAFPVPHGGKPTAPVAGKPAPARPNKTLYSFTLVSPGISGGYNSLVQQVLDFAPGSQTLKHHHGGPGVVTVIQGQVALNANGVEKTYNLGDSFTETPGQTLQAFNRGSTELIVVATYLLPDGAQLTTNRLIHTK